MAIGEEARHALYTRLQAVLGDHEAATLMEHLPPVGWADVATKRDVDMPRIEMQSLEHRIEAALKDGLNKQLRTLVFAIVGSQFTAVSLTFAAVRLA